MYTPPRPRTPATGTSERVLLLSGLLHSVLTAVFLMLEKLPRDPSSPVGRGGVRISDDVVSRRQGSFLGRLPGRVSWGVGGGAAGLSREWCGRRERPQRSGRGGALGRW